MASLRVDVASLTRPVRCLLPGGNTEVHYITELIGIVLIWLGFRLIARDSSAKVHANLAEVAALRS